MHRKTEVAWGMVVATLFGAGGIGWLLLVLGVLTDTATSYVSVAVLVCCGAALAITVRRRRPTAPATRVTVADASFCEVGETIGFTDRKGRTYATAVVVAIRGNELTLDRAVRAPVLRRWRRR